MNSQLVDTGSIDTYANSTTASQFLSAGMHVLRVIAVGNFDFDSFTLQPSSVSINGTVFNDTNDNGGENSGDVGIAGRTVYLDSNDNGKLDAGEPTLTTNSIGYYNFAGLVAGTYTVREVTPSGWVETAPPNVNTMTLTPGQVDNGADFGQYKLTSISGTVFNDTNSNGVQNAGESGLANWKVWLDLNENGVLDANEPTATTSSSGAYTFANVPPSVYQVREVLQFGYTKTLPASYATANVTPGTSITNANFGVLKVAVIGGVVFDDANHNGHDDSTENNLSGRTVYLDLNNNVKIDPGEPQTVTGSLGIWSFSGLNAGTYSVREITPNGWI